jgi:hypothetical protein
MGAPEIDYPAAKTNNNPVVEIGNSPEALC